MIRRLALILLAISVGTPLGAQLRTAPARADFTGIWNSATATPFERPAQLKDREFFTPQEAADWERKSAAQNEEPKRPPNSFVTYNALFYEIGRKLGNTLRTSIITDPSDGRLPPLLPASAAEQRRRQELLRHAETPADLGLQDRCLIFRTAGPPMIPYAYNSNYQIVQTEGYVIIQVEMIHDTRIIPLNGRAHLPSNVRLWLGDSVGHWDGRTLVVDTTNFNDGRGFYGEAGGMFGWDRDLHVVERFRMLDANTILYQFEVDDPTAFTRPWRGELTMSRSSGPIFEYACHEGNYALPNLLDGFRAERNQSAPRTQ